MGKGRYAKVRARRASGPGRRRSDMELTTAIAREVYAPALRRALEKTNLMYEQLSRYDNAPRRSDQPRPGQYNPQGVKPPPSNWAAPRTVDFIPPPGPLREHWIRVVAAHAELGGTVEPSVLAALVDDRNRWRRKARKLAKQG